METLLLTGATGAVATHLRPHLRDRYRLRLADLRPPEPAASSNEDVVVGDLAEPNAAAKAVEGVDAVVHLAGNPDFDADWPTAEQANAALTERLLRTVLDAGIERFVLASSVHAAGGYLREAAGPVDPAWPVRPCCLYGASKVAAEALAAVYAHRYGLAVTCLRIGWFSPRPPSPAALSVWISPPDLAHLIDRALVAGRGYGVYFGVSANTRSRWRIDNARHDLGYRPVDDAESYASEFDDDVPEESKCLH